MTKLISYFINGAKYYLEALEANKYAFSISSFFVVHKLGYLYTELKEYEKANYYINWINEFVSKQDSKISNLLKKISDSLTIKLKDPNYICNKAPYIFFELNILPLDQLDKISEIHMKIYFGYFEK